MIYFEQYVNENFTMETQMSQSNRVTRRRSYTTSKSFLTLCVYVVKNIVNEINIDLIISNFRPIKLKYSEAHVFICSRTFALT